MTYDMICERRGPDTKITSPADLYPLVQRYGAKRQEIFLVISLKADQTVQRIHLVTIGLLNRTLIHPREVFLKAIKDTSASIIIAHSHPSGSLEPSREDKEATARLVSAGHLLGIEVLDHLIISKTSFYSFRENDIMPLAKAY